MLYFLLTPKTRIMDQQKEWNNNVFIAIYNLSPCVANTV